MDSQHYEKSSLRRILTCMVFGLLLISLPGISTANWQGSENELKLLPRYCREHRFLFTPGDNLGAKQEYWTNIMGKSFRHLHHYCWALNTVYRAQRPGLPKQVRIGMWQEVAGDYTYVLTNAEPDFILLPEIYTRLGEVEILRGNPEAANKAFSKARALKPDYWPAYSHWAEYLLAHSQRAEAIQIVRTGLQYAPYAKVLQEQYRVLGGKPSDIPAPSVEPANKSGMPPAPNNADAPDNPASPEAAAANQDNTSPAKP